MYEITKAQPSDFAGIIAVLNANLLSKKKDQDDLELSRQGFLVHGFDEEYLKACYENENALVVVAKKFKNIVGYAITYVMTDDDKKTFLEKCELSANQKSQYHRQKVLYHRHIAKLPDNAGIGKLLMNEILAFGKERNANSVICLIAMEPIRNLISEKFHQQFGFAEVGRLHNQEEQKTYGVFELAL